MARAQHSTPRKCTTTCQDKAFTDSPLQEYAPAEDGESRNPTRTKGHRTDAHRLGSSPVLKKLAWAKGASFCRWVPGKGLAPTASISELAIGFCPVSKLAV